MSDFKWSNAHLFSLFSKNLTSAWLLFYLTYSNPIQFYFQGHLPNPLICKNRPMTFQILCWSRRIARRWLVLQRVLCGGDEKGITLGSPVLSHCVGLSTFVKREVSHHSFQAQNISPFPCPHINNPVARHIEIYFWNCPYMWMVSRPAIVLEKFSLWPV